MRAKIRYRIKSRPRKIKKIADTLIFFGATLFLIGDLFIAPIFRTIPLELWIVFFSELVPLALSQFWIFGLFFLTIGIFLLGFNWYKGTAVFNSTDESIYLSGKISTFLDIKDTKEVNIFSNSIMHKNSVRFDLLYDKISLKFKNKNELMDFIELIIPVVKKYENISVINWEH